MLLQSPTANEEITEQLFLGNLYDAIVPGGSGMGWVESIVNRNKISIDSIIDSDTFGNLSSFDETYPKATEFTKARILKAYLENQSVYVENGVKYPVNDILEVLKGYKQRPEIFDRMLDSAILEEKMAKRVSWLVHLNADTQPIFNTLFQYALLLKIERINEGLDTQESGNLKTDEDLKSWINHEKQKLFKTEAIEYKEAPSYSFLTGNRNIKQLLQQEVVRVVKLVKFTKDSILGSSENSENNPSPTASLKKGLNFVLQLGNIALLPNRLILTSIRESSYFLRLGVNRIFNRLMPNHPRSQTFVHAFTLGVQIALLLTGISYFNLSWRMLFNLQLFPSSWSWGMIGNIVLGYAGLDLSANLIRKGISWVQHLCTGTKPTPRDQSPLPVVEHDIDAEPSIDVDPRDGKEKAASVEAQRQQTPIPGDMRTKLMRLLFEARQSPETYQTTNQALHEETIKLMNNSEPYYLSEVDRVIIHQKGLDETFGLAQQTPNDESSDRNLDDQNIGLRVG